MERAKSNKKFWIGVAVAALLPLSFFILAKVLKKDHLHLPAHFQPEKVIAPGDTVWRRMPEFTATNQMGETVNINTGIEGKVVAINTFFTTCQDVCPKLNANMALIQKAFRKNARRPSDTMVQLVSITTMPEKDSTPVLFRYAQQYKANPDQWWFVRADKAQTYNYLRNELKLSGGEGHGGADDFFHSQMIVLLDKKRTIRGYYDGLDPNQVKKCADDIVLLSLEKEHAKR